MSEPRLESIVSPGEFAALAPKVARLREQGWRIRSGEGAHRFRPLLVATRGTSRIYADSLKTLCDRVANRDRFDRRESGFPQGGNDV